jgi:hypothetical protein
VFLALELLKTRFGSVLFLFAINVSSFTFSMTVFGLGLAIGLAIVLFFCRIFET